MLNSRTCKSCTHFGCVCVCEQENALSRRTNIYVIINSNYTFENSINNVSLLSWHYFKCLIFRIVYEFWYCVCVCVWVSLIAVLSYLLNPLTPNSQVTQNAIGFCANAIEMHNMNIEMYVYSNFQIRIEEMNKTGYGIYGATKETDENAIHYC